MTNSSKKSKVVTDIDSNKLALTFAGRITKKELSNLYTDVRFGVSDLQPGFHVISDFSDCKFMYLNGLLTFRKIFTFLITNECGEMVRVINHSRLVSKQILNLALKMQGYKPTYVSTVEEAEEKFKSSEKSEGIRFHLHEKSIELTIDDSTKNGHILNISKNGCVVTSEELQTGVNEEIPISFELMNQRNSSQEFNINAKIVNAESDTFEMKFMNLDKNIKMQLWQCLIWESDREISTD